MSGGQIVYELHTPILIVKLSRWRYIVRQLRRSAMPKGPTVKDLLRFCPSEAAQGDLEPSTYEQYLTHCDEKPGLDCGKDAIRRAENESNNGCVVEYASPSICSLELDLQVKAEYQTIDTYERAFSYLNHMSLLEDAHHTKLSRALTR